MKANLVSGGDHLFQETAERAPVPDQGEEGLQPRHEGANPPEQPQGQDVTAARYKKVKSDCGSDQASDQKSLLHNTEGDKQEEY